MSKEIPTYWTAKSAIEMFRPGTIVWRNVRLFPRLHEGFNLRAEIDPLMPTRAEKGTVVRVNAPGLLIAEPEALVGAQWGIVAFIQGEISFDWTHLVVEQVVQKDSGGYMTLRQQGKLRMDEYCALRAAMAEAYLPLVRKSENPLEVIDLFDSFVATVAGTRLFVAYDEQAQLFAYRETLNSDGWVQ